ncbi:uncharacterized protein LOC111331948 [Stylophora pistillata]|uniref:uncharacterized protein LOC111331948 n=1 Tax=Stylophora pistillata TaxID=50429 RepID=UPI000C03C35B|nr:uncharacterized protein LOC111331948 [Stylophora pistillata]
MADDIPPELRNASGRRSRLLSSRSKTPRERILSARGYTAFPVVMDINLKAGVSFETLYEENRRGIDDAISGAVLNPSSDDPVVKQISCSDKNLRVKMLYRLDESLLSFHNKYEQTQAKIRGELKKFGIHEMIHFTIENQGQLERKMEEIRLVERALMKGGRGMSGMHIEVLYRQWEVITKDLEVKKILPSLLSREIISGEDMNLIENEATRKDKNNALLKILQKKDSDAFDGFVDSLRRSQEFLAFGLWQEEKKEYKKEQNALISRLNSCLKARSDIYDMKTTLEKDFEEETENMEKETNKLKERVEDLEKELDERKTIMGKGNVNSCSPQDESVGKTGGIPGEQENERENQSELVEISTVIREGCEKLQNEVTEKCSAIIEMILHKKNCRGKKVPEKVKRLEEECQGLHDVIKEREDETKKCNLELKAVLEEKAVLVERYLKTQKENDLLQKKYQNLKAKFWEDRKALETLFRDDRDKTKKHANELAELKAASRKARLHRQNLKEMQRKAEETTKECFKEKESLTSEIKRLRSQLESELKNHIVTTEKLKEELREVRKLNEQAQNKLEHKQSLRSPSTLPAVDHEEGQKKKQKTRGISSARPLFSGKVSHFLITARGNCNSVICYGIIQPTENPTILRT